MGLPAWITKRRGLIPLDSETCGSWSIYHINAQGELWTLDSSQKEPFKQVRDGIFHEGLPIPGFVCVSCGAFEHHVEEMEAAHSFGSSVGIKLEIV